MRLRALLRAHPRRQLCLAASVPPMVARGEAGRVHSGPMNARAKEMADAIKTATNGRFDRQIFPNNQLGSDMDMLRFGPVDPGSRGIGFAFPEHDTA